MLDIRLIRTEPDRVKAEFAKVGFPAAEVDALLDADRRRREALHAVEQLRAERTAASKAIRDIGDSRGSAMLTEYAEGIQHRLSGEPHERRSQLYHVMQAQRVADLLR